MEQMTDDERVNWFPHPSPTGDTVLYVAYENGVEGHPRDKRAWSSSPHRTWGGPAASVRSCRSSAGPGSINVPCWHPDGRRFAFRPLDARSYQGRSPMDSRSPRPHRPRSLAHLLGTMSFGKKTDERPWVLGLDEARPMFPRGLGGRDQLLR
jgi:hypothetical protein